ncbi:MAG: rhomboid family intramembrane serine protease, partial [Candidatus Aenigmatarchaeota archaeon]
MKKYEKPSLTYSIIAICIIAFIFEISYGLQFGSFGSENFKDALVDLFTNYGFSLQNLITQKYWTLITSIFLHADTEHLILNVIALFFFGRVVELELGRKKFLLIFFTSSIAGCFSFLAFSFFINSFSIVIGASAAIFGLMGTAMLVKPLEFVFYPYLIPVPLILVAMLYTLYNIASFLLIATNIEDSNISYISHIGGLTAGMLFGFREEG